MHTTIEKLVVFMMTDTDTGEENIMMLEDQTGILPLIAVSEENIPAVLWAALEISKTLARPFKIAEFSVRKDVTQEILKQYEPAAPPPLF